MNAIGDILVIVGLIVVVWYGYYLFRQFKQDQRENWEVPVDQERAQWNELWDDIEPLSKNQRRAIRHCVHVLLTNGGGFVGIGENLLEPHLGNGNAVGSFDKVGGTD